MKNFNLRKNLAAATLALSVLIMPLLAIGQTRISMPKNRYSVQQDVELGRRAAAEIEQQMPILNDAETTRYVQDVGRRLVNAIPSQFRQPGFQYSFKVVNASDINAFALPGGPMYVNRGMIEAARNEGEMAGVMAHELSHVALRHGTAQATKAANPKAQLPAIGGAILGAILGGQAGGAIAQAGQLGSAAIVTRYSREYETQADILGSQIMANAGYDPRDLANMFKTIERESGGSRSPEWLSSHPNPGNRYANIEREAQLLRVSGNPIGRTAQFERVQSRLRGMGRAQTMQEIAQNGQRYPQGGGQRYPQDGQGQSPIAGGRYSSRVQLPSTRSQVFSSGGIQMSVPGNWRQFSQSQSEVWFAPDGAYGDQGITHGALVGFGQTRSNNLDQATEEYVSGILQSNEYLRQSSNYSRVNFGGRQGYAIVLSGRSPVTNRNEVTTVYTTQLRSGGLFYVVTVAPQNEAAGYNNAFRRMLSTLRIND
ncbi:MAG TPA: M48 family metallopeptidase [Pyrinomonadaceae bacterium]|nr:M48 family metallopeptidase [Pyrinomonadaceae bacterium]